MERRYFDGVYTEESKCSGRIVPSKINSVIKLPDKLEEIFDFLLTGRGLNPFRFSSINSG